MDVMTEAELARYRQARAAISGVEPSAAMAALRAMAESDPQNAVARAFLVTQATACGADELAAKTSRQALRQQTSAWALAAEGLRLMHYGERKATGELAIRGLGLDPDCILALTLAANAAELAGNFAAAEGCQRRVIALVPEEAHAWHAYVQAACLSFREKEAAKRIDNGPPAYAQSAYHSADLASVARLEHREADALAHFEEATRRDPFAARWQYLLARCYLERADYAAARTSAAKALGLLPNDLSALTVAESIEISAGEAKAAIPFSERRSKLSIKLPGLEHVAEARRFQQIGYLREAVRALEMAVAEADYSGRISACLTLVTLLADLRDWPRAEALFKNFDGFESEPEKIAVVRARMLAARGHGAEAVRSLEGLLDKRIGAWLPGRWLLILLTRYQRLGERTKWADRMADADPDTVAAAHAITVSLIVYGEAESADRILSKMLQKFPEAQALRAIECCRLETRNGTAAAKDARLTLDPRWRTWTIPKTLEPKRPTVIDDVAREFRQRFLRRY